MMRENRCKPVLWLPLVLALTGCMGLGKGSFTCPGGSTDGARCLSAREVYQATEHSDTVAPGTGAERSGSAAPPAAAVGGAANLSPVPIPSLGQPLPIRSQASVMRVWLAPWEDDHGDLHTDGFVYTEIESRRWNLGGRHKAPNPGFAPITSRRD